MEDTTPKNNEPVVSQSSIQNGWVLGILALILLLAGIYYSFTPNGALKFTEKNTQLYTEKYQNFSVEYPKEWVTYEVKGEDVSLGGVNIFPKDLVEKVPEKNLRFDQTAYFLPFDQHHGDYPSISVGGIATYDIYTTRTDYDFKKTNQYKILLQYLKGWERDGTFKNVIIEDVMVGDDPALVAVYEIPEKKAKVFYMVKLAKDSITEKVPMTAYYIVQYFSPISSYSETIANSLRTTFKDNLAAGIAESKAQAKESEKTSSSSPSQGNIWKVASVKPFGKEINHITFDYEFNSKSGAQGVLGLIWDDKLVGSVDERYNQKDKAEFFSPVGKSFKENYFTLAFRLDSFTKVPSSVIISNIQLHYLDPRGATTSEKVADLIWDQLPVLNSSATSSVGTLTIKSSGQTPEAWKEPVVKILINGSETPPLLKMNKQFTLSWSVDGRADKCEAAGYYIPKADGSGAWAQGDRTLSTQGSVTLIANQPSISLQVICSADSGKSTYVSGRDEVDLEVVN